MSNENNKMQVDIENLFKQNVNDLSAIKELYRKLKEVDEKISQIKYIDTTLSNKLKKDYEKLKKIILDENAQAELANDIEKINTKLTNDIKTINVKLTNDIETINSQMDTIAQQIELYKNKQSINLSKFQQELFYKNYDTSIACVGDSLTFGLDEVSEDRRASTDDVTDVGVSANPISKFTYPEILRACLWEVYGKSFTVKKMAVGGDTLTKALQRWTTNPNVKIAIMMFGTNDSYREENTEAFIKNYFELIKRFLDWGTAIVLLTPPKKVEYSEIQDVHAEVVKSLGKMLNIPVIDTREIFDGYPLDDLTTDYVHFKSDMYYLLGAKISNLFVLKKNLIEPFKLDSGNHLFCDLQSNNCFVNPNGRQEFINNCTYSPMDVGKTAENGKSIKLYENGKIYFSFYNDKDMVLIPLFRTTSNGKCVIDVNFRGKQPTKKYDFITEEIGNNYVPSHQKRYGVNESRESLKLEMSDLNSNIVITSRGINSVCVNNGATGVVEFFGFYVMSLEDYYIKKGETKTLVVGEDIAYEQGFSNLSSLKTKIIKKDGFVDIQIAIKVTETGVTKTGFNTIFTLPEGFRPDVTSSFVLKNYEGGHYDQVYIEDWTGLVKNQSTTTNDLTGYIRFKCK